MRQEQVLGMRERLPPRNGKDGVEGKKLHRHSKNDGGVKLVGLSH